MFHAKNDHSPDLKGLVVERGYTQKDVNQKVLDYLVERIPRDVSLKAVDFPCGGLAFLSYLKHLYPSAELLGSDIVPPPPRAGIDYVCMDLSKEFTLPRENQFDLITCISGVMMFSNTQSFFENCAARLKKGGIFVVTNDNSMTLPDRLRYLFLGRLRMFSPIYEDDENLTQNVSIVELVRLHRSHGFEIEKIEYTSFYAKDLWFLPLALLIYPVQYMYLRTRQTSALAKEIRWALFPFKHMLYRHYIIFSRKR